MYINVFMYVDIYNCNFFILYISAMYTHINTQIHLSIYLSSIYKDREWAPEGSNEDIHSPDFGC